MYLIVKAIGIQHIIIVDIQLDGSAGNLVLADLNLQDLGLWEGEFLYYKHITIALLEMLIAVQHKLWCQLDTLIVGGLLLLLILQLDSYL